MARQTARFQLHRDLGLGLAVGKPSRSSELMAMPFPGRKRPDLPRGLAVARTTWRMGQMNLLANSYRAGRRRHRHDRAGAIAGKHVVGDPDRDLFAIDRIVWPRRR